MSFMWINFSEFNTQSNKVKNHFPIMKSGSKSTNNF